MPTGDAWNAARAIERNVIGAVIRAAERGNTTPFYEAHAMLRSADRFSDDRCAEWWDAIVAVSLKGGAPTRTMIRAHFAEPPYAPRSCDLDTVVAETSIQQVAEFELAVEAIVERAATRRVFLELSEAYHEAARAHDHGDAGYDSRRAATETADRLIRAVNDVHNRSTGRFIGDALEAYKAAMSEEEAKSRTPHMRFGIPVIDSYIGQSIRGGNFVVCGAHAKVGKTAVATGLLKANGLHGDLRPALLTLEMTERETVERILSDVANVPYANIVDGRLGSKDEERIKGAYMLIEERAHGAWIQPMPSATLADVLATTRGLVAAHGVQMVVVDYIQIIDVPRNHNREREVADVSRQLKQLALELDIVIVALTQLNDETLSRTGDKRRPLVSDSRESKALKLDADLMFVIDRPLSRTDPTFHDGVAAKWRIATSGEEVELARFDFGVGRRRKAAWFEVRWEGDYQRFSEPPPKSLMTQVSTSFSAERGFSEDAF